MSDGNAVLRDLLAWLYLSPERGDLHDLRAEADVGEPEAPADNPAIPEELLDLIRVRGGADVEVLRPSAEQEIAHAPADEIRDVVVLPKSVQHFERIRVDVAARKCVLLSGDHLRLGHRAELYQKG